jgi:hypothetical protein
MDKTKSYWVSETTVYKVWDENEEEAFELIDKHNEGDYKVAVKIKAQEREIEEVSI